MHFCIMQQYSVLCYGDKAVHYYCLVYADARRIGVFIMLTTVLLHTRAYSFLLKVCTEELGQQKKMHLCMIQKCIFLSYN